jgi:hypothetical protein
MEPAATKTATAATEASAAKASTTVTAAEASTTVATAAATGCGNIRRKHSDRGNCEEGNNRLS